MTNKKATIIVLTSEIRELDSRVGSYVFDIWLERTCELMNAKLFEITNYQEINVAYSIIPPIGKAIKTILFSCVDKQEINENVLYTLLKILCEKIKGD